MDSFLPIELQNKMDMSSMGSSSTTTTATTHTCKISMLWNWYTIDSCFLAKSWHVTSRGMFAGTCIGVFFWVMAYCWYHRFVVEFDRNVADFKQVKFDKQQQSVGADVSKANVASNCCCDDDESSENDDKHTPETSIEVAKPGSNFTGPLLAALSHKWFLPNKNPNVVYPSPLEHIARSGFYLCEWTVSYLLMLMWMYYNGYLIITMILGYFFGQLLFNYAPVTVVNKRDLAEFPIRP